MNGYRITAFRVNHNVICYGYTLEILRQGKFSPERAREQGNPAEVLESAPEGADDRRRTAVIYTPDMVLGPERKGIKVTYTTDTRPTESILRNAKGSDLFICEGMYGEEDKIEKGKGLQAYDIQRSSDTCEGCEG